MADVQNILSRWGGHSKVAADAKVPYPTAQAWYRRKSVPAAYWPALLVGANSREISLTADELLMAHASTPKVDAA